MENPCINCAYFDVCGDVTREKDCKGRKDKKESKTS